MIMEIKSNLSTIKAILRIGAFVLQMDARKLVKTNMKLFLRNIHRKKRRLNGKKLVI